MSNTRRGRAVGFSVAVAGTLIDQAFKLWMLGPFAIEDEGPRGADAVP